MRKRYFPYLFDPRILSSRSISQDQRSIWECFGKQWFAWTHSDLMTASFSLQSHSVMLVAFLLFTVSLWLPVVKLFCLKLLLPIRNITIPCNHIKSVIFHVRLLGDSNTTRKERCSARLGRCSGEGTGPAKWEVASGNLALVLFTSYCLLCSTRQNLFQPLFNLLWHFFSFLVVQVDMWTIILKPNFTNYEISISVLWEIWELEKSTHNFPTVTQGLASLYIPSGENGVVIIICCLCSFPW